MTHREFTFVRFKILPASDRSLERVSSMSCSCMPEVKLALSSSVLPQVIHGSPAITELPADLHIGKILQPSAKGLIHPPGIQVFPARKKKEARNIFITWLSNSSVKPNANILITMKVFKCFSHSAQALVPLLLSTAGSTPS